MPSVSRERGTKPYGEPQTKLRSQILRDRCLPSKPAGRGNPTLGWFDSIAAPWANRALTVPTTCTVVKSVEAVYSRSPAMTPSGPSKPEVGGTWGEHQREHQRVEGHTDRVNDSADLQGFRRPLVPSDALPLPAPRCLTSRRSLVRVQHRPLSDPLEIPAFCTGCASFARPLTGSGSKQGSSKCCLPATDGHKVVQLGGRPEVVPGLCRA